MSEVKVNKISPRTNCGTVTLGDSGDTFTIPAGVTLTNSGTATGFGPTGAVSWDTTPKTTTVTAASGVGYFVDTTSGAITVNLPAGSAGSIVAISDYANTAATNNITIDPNGTDKINGLNENAEITTNGVAVTLIYVDSTIGWKDVNDATLDVTGINPFIVATGGTILTCGDYKTHVFTGPGTFTVTCAGTPLGSNSVEYLTVAGGGGAGSGVNAGGGPRAGGGGGAGGYRQNYPSPTTAGLPVTATSYPITVGSGGAGSPSPSPSNKASSGNDSIFSTITSAGGGFGQNSYCQASPVNAGAGGSGGGGSGGGVNPNTSGAGNTPPTSPPQGNPGSPNNGTGPGFGGTGGGGAGAAGPAGRSPAPIALPGGIGSPIATTFFGPTAPSYGTTGPAPGRYFAGGGGGGGAEDGTRCGGAGGEGGGGAGGTYPTPAPGINGTVNTGGGGGGGTGEPCGRAGGTGGSGIVVIRYKFQ
jgi:hypothetical protein